MTNTEDQLLFHYCPLPTMVNIVKGKQLWMSDIISSNDYSETRMIYPDILYGTEDYYREHPFPFSYDGTTGIDAIRRLLIKTSGFLDSLYQKGVISSFVSCFCEDGDVLSQWRGYANDGRGCSLGFSLKELQNYCAQKGNIIRIEKVEYVNNRVLDDLIVQHASEINTRIQSLENDSNELLKNKANKETIEELMALLLVQDFERLIMDSLVYKWEGFKEEKEWRLFFNEIPKLSRNLFTSGTRDNEVESRFDRPAELLKDQIGFIAKDEVIVPYFPLMLDDLSELPIKLLYLGPKNKSQKEDVKMLFDKYMNNIPKIEYSDISYC